LQWAIRTLLFESLGSSVIRQPVEGGKTPVELAGPVRIRVWHFSSALPVCAM
jgi:hypothetical protein